MRWWQIPLLALIAALGGITTALAIDTSSALYTSNIQLFNLGLTRQNFPAATEISGSALIDAAFMEADTLNAVVHEGPTEIPSMPPNNRIRIQDFVSDDGGSFVDWQVEAQSSTELDFPLLPATPAVDDAAYFACDNPCRIITINIGQEAVADDLSILWEYFNGTAFVTASNVVDRTESFTLAGMRTVSFDMPSDFATTSVTGSAVGATYWIRGRVIDVDNPTQQAIGTEAWYENGQWWMWGKTQNINQELLYNLSVGGPDLVTNHQIIPGDAGIVTPDNASIELGDTYTVHFDGSINFTAGVTGSNVCIVCKDGAFRLYISDFDAITLDVTGAGTTSLTLDGIPDSINLPTSTSPNAVDVISDGTDVTLAVDGVGSSTGTAQTVTDNANDWSFGSNGGFVFADTIYFLPDDTATAFEIFDTETQWDTGILTDMISTGGQPALTEQFLTEASADDGFWLEGSSAFSNSAVNTIFGFIGGASTVANAFYRFDNVRIDQGAIITAADLVFTPQSASALATVSVDIVAVNEDDAAAPTTFAGAEALARTTAVVPWSPVPSWVTSPLTLETSPDISAVIQEIIDRPGWVSGNSIVILVEDNGSTAVNNTIRTSCSFEAECEATRLEITMDTGQTFTDDFIEMEATATDVSNAGFLENWTHDCSGNGCVSRVREFGAGNRSKARFGTKSFDIRAGVNVGNSAQVLQDIDASEGQVWSFSANYTRTDEDDDTATFQITFRDAPGGVVLQTNTANLAESTTLYQVATINNITAPSGTASIRVRAFVTCNATCTSADGISLDGIMAARAAVAPNWPDAANELSNSSFEQVFQTSATWVSPSIALNQTSVASSNITWDSFNPFTSTLLVETNLNGAGFVTATNNATIPGISVGDDVSGQTLQVRITTTPSDPDLQVFSPWASLLAVIINDDVLEDQSVLFYQLRETPSFEIDDLSPNVNNGVMSYPVQLTGIFSAMTPLRSNRVPLSQESAIGVGDFAASVTGSAANLNLFGDDTGADFIPFVGIATDSAQAAGFPTAWIWVMLIMALGLALGAGVWRFTNGNELMVSIVLAGTLVLAAALGDGLIPGWVPFVAIIMLSVYNVVRSRLPI